MGFEHKFLSVLKIYKDGDLVDPTWTQNYCQTWNNNIYVYEVKHVFHILPLSETQLENQLLQKNVGKEGSFWLITVPRLPYGTNSSNELQEAFRDLPRVWF